MILSLAVRLGLLAQVAALPTRRAPDPIRVWRADSTVYVSVRDRSYLVVLHVDPVGRILVLFPTSPDDDPAVPGGPTFALPVPLSAESGTGTILAARSRRPFQFGGLRAGPGWDYDHALLLQPTAGDPLAALLDIADRIADGQSYEFDVATYRSGKGLAARDPQLATPVCLTCARRGAPEQAAPVIAQSNSVDCSNAVLVNSFCGVANGSVSISTVNETVYEAPPPATPVYVPYYVPIFVPRRHRFTPPPPAPRVQDHAITLRLARGVGAPPRREPSRVQAPQQPYAPSRPWRRPELDTLDVRVVPTPPPPPPPPVAAAASAPVALPMSRDARWMGTRMQIDAPASPTPVPAATQSRAERVREPHAGTATGLIAPRRGVPSRAVLRTITSRRP